MPTKTKTYKNENKDFIMLYRTHIDDITRLAGEHYTAYRVLQFLIRWMDGTNALVISMQAMSDILGLSRQTISKAVAYLKDEGWICVMKSGTSNVYIVNPEVAWTSYADQKSLCNFNASVLLSSSENAEYLKNSKATTHYRTIDKSFMDTVRKNSDMRGQLSFNEEGLIDEERTDTP